MNFEKEKLYYVAMKIKLKHDKFTVINFFKYINFVEFDENYYDHVMNLINNYYGENSLIYNIIKKFMDDNYIKEIAPLDFDSLFDNDVYINNVLITEDMINNILDYMKTNNYPMINYVYGYLINKYVNNKKIIDEDKQFKLIKGGRK